MSFFFIPVIFYQTKTSAVSHSDCPKSILSHFRGNLLKALSHLETYNPGVLTSMVPMITKNGIQIKIPQSP